MRIKRRLGTTFLIITLIPLFFILLGWTLLKDYRTGMFLKAYGISSRTDIEPGNSLKLYNLLTEEIYQELEKGAGENPGQFRDAGVLDSYNRELTRRYSYLVLREGQQITYCGSEEKIPEYLPAWTAESREGSTGSGCYIDEGMERLVKPVFFSFPDGKPAGLFIVTRAEGTVPEMKEMFTDMAILAVCIILLTAMGVILWMYRALYSPLLRLTAATKKIRDGDLDFSLEVENDEEIGELFQDFEEMRIRLRDSAEEKLRNDRESKELISNISHDLKTPITAIKGYVEGILDGVASSPEKLDRYIRTIYNKANDMDHLIDELMFYSKIDTNKVPYHYSRLRVSDYFEDCAEEVGLDMETRGVSFTYENKISPDVMVIADAEQLKRVVNNIINNSFKYMDKQEKKISLEIRDDGDFIHVVIADNGKGISAADLPHIFDRFYRTDSSRNSSTGGSGIGLSIVKKIIEDHSGRIWAISREGEGTEMHFVLRKYLEVTG